MSELLLSIVTPSIPSRKEMLAELSAKIKDQIGDLPVEHLVFVNDKILSIGEKRDALLRRAAGRFVSMVDDDEGISNTFVADLVQAITDHPDVDVITFKQRVRLSDGNPFVITFGLGNENQQTRHDDFGYYLDITRQPWHSCAWRASLAKQSKYPPTSYAEDHAFLEPLWAMAKTSHHIDKVLHQYVHDERISEAPDRSNPAVMHKLVMEGRA